MIQVKRWTGREAAALRQARRMSIRAYAAHLGVTVSTVANWEQRGRGARLRHLTQELLDVDLARAGDDVRARFDLIIRGDPSSMARSENEPTAPLDDWLGPSDPDAPYGRVAMPAVGAGHDEPRHAPWIGRPYLPDSTAQGALTARRRTASLLGEWMSAVTISSPTDPMSDATELAYAVPAGRYFSGSSVEVHAFPAVDDGMILASLPAELATTLLQRPRRCLLVGVASGSDEPRLFGLDSRHARRRQRQGHTNSPLRIPHAYLLDDLTLGLLWAVSNLDDALLDDDAEIARCCTDLAGYEFLPRSTAARDSMIGLSPVAQMWLGSRFCARHILRHLEQLAEAPAFWTREQRGEEASTWLLFRHKYEYLQAIADRVGAPVTRSWCVPSSLLADSARPERMLLSLAGALMESFGIEVQVCAEPEYAAVEGFVLDPRRQVIVANWVDADRIWHVDVTGRRPQLREYADIAGHASSHSVIAAASPAGRLRRLAAYLELDWTLLVRRCAELAQYGCAGVAQPRSRLLATDGVDRACRFLADVARAGE